ncbi:MAG: Ig-like domain-containing protein [Anaerolineales bacterium]|jgi:hypothetical protein
MNRKVLLLLLISLTLILAVACSTATASPGPGVWIDNPPDGLIINLGDPVHINGHVSKPAEVTEVHVAINGETIYRLLPTVVQADMASFSAVWIPESTGDHLIHVWAIFSDGGVSDLKTAVVRVISSEMETDLPPEGTEQTGVAETPSATSTPTSTPPPTATLVPTTVPTLPPTPDTTGPPSPGLVSPINNVDPGCVPFVQLVWNSVSDPSGIDHYNVEAQINRGSGWVVAGQWSTGIPKVIPHECETAYRWRVQAVDGVGNEGSFSAWGYFSNP